MTKPGGISMDWIELFADDRKRLTKLFADCPGLHGCITAVLQGGTGAVFRQGVLGGVFVCRRKEQGDLGDAGPYRTASPSDGDRQPE